MAVFHGIAVNFGVSSSLASVTGLFQTRDHNYRVSDELIMDGLGTYQTKNYYAFVEEANFEYVATGNGTASGTATVLMPSASAQLTVTDTQYTQIAGTTWLVDDVSTKGSNTTSVRVTCKLSRYPSIIT